MSDWDAIVVGGGSAGVAAARTLADAGRSVLIVEAANRLGGRAHTLTLSGQHLDMGCGWLHSAERNPWVAIAERKGLALNRDLPGWREQWRDLGFPPDQQRAAYAAYAAFEDRMRRAPPASDRASDLLDPHSAWNPYIDALSGFINGAGVSRLSVTDYLAYMDVATDQDWRVEAGYGTLVAGHAAALPVALSTPVTAIRTDGARLALETDRGTLTAAAAIVTVSTNVLASGAIALPPTFADTLHAASQLPLGNADKLFFELDGWEEFPPDAHLLGNPHQAVTGAFTLRPFGRPIAECFLGGEGARAFEMAGLDAAADFAIGQLAALLGNDMHRRLRLIAGSSWAREDHVLGAYSQALPGQHAMRRVLATAVDPRIRFAGEACHDTDFSTCHGAYETGVAAARALLT